MEDAIELSKVIQMLRKELTEAVDMAMDKDIRFNVSNLNIELQTVVEKEEGGEAGINAKFLVLFGANAKVNSKYKNSMTHKITLSMKPVGKDGKNLLLSDEE